ncbi:MAG: DUF6144 family protein [Candidatus Hodarchaeota archaeon]
MKFNGFKEYLHKQNLDEDKIGSAIEILREFDEFVSRKQSSTEKSTYDDVHNFSEYLIKNKKNSYDNYVYLLRYGHFMTNNNIIIACMEILDGSEVITNFSKRLSTEFGEEIRDAIFDIEIPPLGLHPNKRPKITKHLLERFLDRVDHSKCVAFLADGLRDKYTESYKAGRNKFIEMNNIDQFLEFKHQDLIKRLKKHLEEGKLWYTQEIDEKVLEYIKSNRMTEAGLREGNKVIITKVPYMTKQYLNETDERKKHYYYCHCPWVREALKEEDQPVNPIFCNCSGGYYKNYWEAILEQPVKVELLESVLMGDQVCKFALHLPQGIVEKIESKKS